MVAPAAADATGRARACCALSTTRNASHASGLRLLDIFVTSTSACFTPENRLVGVVERPLSPRRRICQIRGAGMGARVLRALRVALCRARRAQVAAVEHCRARGGQLVALSGAGESWRRDAPESGGVLSASFVAGGF